MQTSTNGTIISLCKDYGNSPMRLMDVVQAVQAKFGHVSGEAMEIIARQLGTHRVEVQGVVSFYAFLSEQPQGKIVIRLSNCAMGNIGGAQQIGEALEQELGISFGQTTPDSMISLEHTSCIGMCDQCPAALVNDVVVTGLTPDSAREMARKLKQTGDPRSLITQPGEGNNASELVNQMVRNNLRKAGEVIFSDYQPGAALAKALELSPEELIGQIKDSKLRGRGGAGFPTGMKWEFARRAKGERRFVICNADEGEPGTFKDRVILTQMPELMIEGMTLAGYAIGSSEGIIYLRGEYAYLRRFLEATLDQRRAAGLLGKDIGGKAGFYFDIRIQMGAGAYICGEETALIASAEGGRGEPKNRPPFPAQKGYLDAPTIVNNVETFCCAARVAENGPAWFAAIGDPESPGTKLLSVSGDIERPGVYEMEMGVTVTELLAEVGAQDAVAVQVGGPSGQCIGQDKFDNRISYSDLATGGSMMVFGPQRDVLEIASHFMEFFIEESCGFCTPCRVGNVLLKQRLDLIREGQGEPSDIDYLTELGKAVKVTSRCGLGQTSPNPILTTIENFRALYDSKLHEVTDGMQSTFDINKALGDAVRVQGRQPVHFDD
ncbi:MAG: NAD(P)H-dependent oxidoreductase subunit E [Candidatus Alcyoniella australis]|nr:NAD(P)H-dependent oxidoreductase subunit E [Candidatus Alcyoniella australis]